MADTRYAVPFAPSDRGPGPGGPGGRQGSGAGDQGCSCGNLGPYCGPTDCTLTAEQLTTPGPNAADSFYKISAPATRNCGADIYSP